MAFSKYKDLSTISNLSDIEEELFLQQKALFELKIKKTIDKKEKSLVSHFYTHFKRRIAHLQQKKSFLLKSQDVKKNKKK